MITIFSDSQSLDICLETQLKVTNVNFKKVALVVIMKHYKPQKIVVTGNDFTTYADTFSFLDTNLGS